MWNTTWWIFKLWVDQFVKIYRFIKFGARAADSLSWAVLRKGYSFINTEKIKIIHYLVPQHWLNAFSYPTPSEFSLLQDLVWTWEDGNFCELGHQSCHQNHSGPQCPRGSPDLCPHPASPGVGLSSWYWRLVVCWDQTWERWRSYNYSPYEQILNGERMLGLL